MNKRSCHVPSCKENEALDVIATIGQAFKSMREIKKLIGKITYSYSLLDYNRFFCHL